MNYPSPKINEISPLETASPKAENFNKLIKSFKNINRRNDLKFNFYELICVPLRRNTGKIKTFKIAKEYTQNLLCVTTIHSKISEINKVKCLTFNNEQLKLFNCIPTPSYHNMSMKTQDIWEDLVISKKPIDSHFIVDSFKRKEEYILKKYDKL